MALIFDILGRFGGEAIVLLSFECIALRGRDRGDRPLGADVGFLAAGNAGNLNQPFFSESLKQYPKTPLRRFCRVRKSFVDGREESTRGKGGH